MRFGTVIYCADPTAEVLSEEDLAVLHATLGRATHDGKKRRFTIKLRRPTYRYETFDLRRNIIVPEQIQRAIEEEILVPGVNPKRGDMKNFLEEQRRIWL